MSNWRDYILQHFRQPIHRLTLVADPDGLMLEEELLVAVRQNGFDLLPFEDPIAFRYAYESGHRQRGSTVASAELSQALAEISDQGRDTDLVVILRLGGAPDNQRYEKEINDDRPTRDDQSTVTSRRPGGPENPGPR